MVELLVAMTLLTLIVLALMAVFDSTQRAFRASVTQTGILEGSRAAINLMVSDLSGMAPSYGVSNYVYTAANNSYNYGAVNFCVTNFNPNVPPYPYYAPLVQPLPGSEAKRTNVLEAFFLLGRQNTQWIGVGYAVNAGSASPLYPLYRFYCQTNVSFNPVVLYWNFLNTLTYAQNTGVWTNMSHIMDGVIHLTARAYDLNGYLMTNTVNYSLPGAFVATNNLSYRDNVWFQPYLINGEDGLVCYSNAVPAAVELEMGVLEDRVLQRAESLGNGSPTFQFANNTAQWAYLQNQAGHVYLFRQRVTIPNVDSSAYQ